jgi:uncharacterized membrane protein
MYTQRMSIRLQVVMDNAEHDAIRAAARERGMTVSEWVRETLREARQKVATGDAERKLAAIRAADRLAYPTADIDQMVAEIERGYGEANE